MSVGAAFVIMGVSGCGKSSIGKRVAYAVGGGFIDGDQLHPAENIAKMSRGEPLDDADREPWLKKVGQHLQGGEKTIIACSALKRCYRDQIAAEAGRPVTFLYLQGTRKVLLKRMECRTGHFMPVPLLDSQIATLEPPQADEQVITANIDQPPEQVVATLVEGIQRNGL